MSCGCNARDHTFGGDDSLVLDHGEEGGTKVDGSSGETETGHVVAVFLVVSVEFCHGEWVDLGKAVGVVGAWEAVRGLTMCELDRDEDMNKSAEMQWAE